MIMTNKEIVDSYNAAKKKGPQIGVLADLCCCTRDEIKKILVAEGAELPKRGPKKAQTEEKTQDSPLIVEMPEVVKQAIDAQMVTLQCQIDDQEEEAKELEAQANEIRAKIKESEDALVQCREYLKAFG